MSSGARNFLFNNVKPGVMKEQKIQLGWIIVTDLTFNSGNTLIIEPIDTYGLSGIRESKTIVVKNISDTFISPDLFAIKIEGSRIRTWDDY